MDILLHICCGPCLIYPFSRLKEQGLRIRGYYYNPNIYPVSEYYRRVAALEILRQGIALDVEYPENKESDFFQAIGTVEPVAQRCVSCWSLRLQKTAIQAKRNGFRSFSTTLLASPYQNHQRLKQLGEQISRQVEIDFYYEDFRIGFKQSQIEAKHKGLYRQKYCGCRYSLKPIGEISSTLKAVEL